MTQSPDSPTDLPSLPSLRQQLADFMRQHDMPRSVLSALAECDKETVDNIMENRHKPREETVRRLLRAMRTYKGLPGKIEYCPACGQRMPAKHTHRSKQERPRPIQAKAKRAILRRDVAKARKIGRKKDAR